MARTMKYVAKNGFEVFSRILSLNEKKMSFIIVFLIMPNKCISHTSVLLPQISPNKTH